MVYIDAGKNDPWWFGVAWEGEGFVATAIGKSRDQALSAVRRCVPNGVIARSPAEASPFLAEAVIMLGDLERGHEEQKEFHLSQYRSDSMRRILTAASAIPIGYVTSYGDIAKTAGSEARAVGRAMATNPLYPIVPCHRVVGADMTMVGYGGKQDERALSSKLARLVAEAHGFSHETEIAVLDGTLTVYPAERAIDAANSRSERENRELRLKAEREEADRKQLRLF